MPLNSTLLTNEVKDRTGAEVEFTRRENGPGARVEFQRVAESPQTPHRLVVSHQETGSQLKRRRRSLVRFDKTSISSVDLVTPVTTSAYIVVDAPVGAITTTTELAEVLANLLSFCATTGAATTVLFDGTGTGAVPLISGSL